MIIGALLTVDRRNVILTTLLASLSQILVLWDSGVPWHWWGVYLLAIDACGAFAWYAVGRQSVRFLEAARLGRYFSPAVAAAISSAGTTRLAEHREVTVLFADLRGFTALSEKMDSAAVAALLNEYLEAMVTVVFGRSREGGVPPPCGRRPRAGHAVRRP